MKKKIASDVTDTLKAREKTYGNFFEQAHIGQALKNVVQLQPRWSELEDDQKEALEMICVKVARIMNGDPNYQDNWHDIEGYARLVAQRLEDSK